jgi:hypothetical protein
MALFLDQSQLENAYDYCVQGNGIYEGYYAAQVFTAGISGDLEQVKLWLSKYGSPDTLVVELQAVTSDKPNGNVLASTTIAPASVGGYPGSEVTATFGTPYNITDGTKYAIVIYQQGDGGDWSNLYEEYGDGYDNLYANGNGCYSNNSGSTWTITASSNLYFKTYVEADPLAFYHDTLTVESGAHNLHHDTIPVESGAHNFYHLLGLEEIKQVKETIDSDARITGIYYEEIDSDSTIVTSRVQKQLTSQALIIDEQTKVINSDAIVKTINDEDIDSDAKLIKRKQESISSNAEIYSTIHFIDSDTIIKVVEIQKHIYSSARMVTSLQESIESDAEIAELTKTKTIDSDASIVGQNQVDIESDAAIRARVWQYIDSDSELWNHKDFYCKLRAEVETEKDFYLQLKVNQPTPVDVTNLTATDPQTGESIVLDWDEDSNYGYNVYKDVGGSWVKQNDTTITENNYVAGSLTTGVTYTFKVTAVNGVDEESSGVEIEGTPTYNIERYTEPNYEIKIAGVTQTDAVLSRVELIYGTAFSTTDFYIPKSPQTVGLPEASRQTVQVYINSRLVFTGLLIKRENIYDAKELKVNYTAVNTLWNMTLYSVGTGASRPPGYPVSMWDSIQVASLTGLEYRDYYLRHSGNYKIYCSPSGSISNYRVGNPVSRRTYEVGKHIIKQDLGDDWSNPSKSVTVYSDEKQLTVTKGWSTGWSQASLGNVMTINAKEISGVQVFAKINEKPEVTQYLTEIDVLPGHIENKFGGKFVNPSFSLPTFSLNGNDENVDDGDVEITWKDGGSEARKPVKSYRYFVPEWKPVSAQVEYEEDTQGKTKSAKITITDYPKVWHHNMQRGTAVFKESDEDGNITENELSVSIWNEPYWKKASIKVVYTYKTDRLSSTAGSGIASRRIYDGVVPYSISVPNDIPYQYESDDNFSDVSSYLSAKASEEASKQSPETTKGNITILGDETLDLRTHVNGYEVMRVTHDFSRGFLTHIDLTNESYHRGVAIFERKEMATRKYDITENRSRIFFNYYDMKKVKAIVGENKTDPGTNPKGGAAYYTD